MLVFTLLSVIGFAVAVILKERAKQLYISSGSMFSADILLAAGFVHLLSDSTGSFSNLCREEVCFPWSFAVAGFTIVLLVCIEMLVTDIILRNKDKHDRKKGHTPTTEEREVITANNTVDNNESAAREQLADRASSSSSSSSLNSIFIPGDTEELNWLTALVITIALGIHSIIEAIGIGATNDISEIQSSFVAIAVHKGFTYVFGFGGCKIKEVMIRFMFVELSVSRRHFHIDCSITSLYLCFLLVSFPLYYYGTVRMP